MQTKTSDSDINQIKRNRENDDGVNHHGSDDSHSPSKQRSNKRMKRETYVDDHYNNNISEYTTESQQQTTTTTTTIDGEEVDWEELLKQTWYEQHSASLLQRLRDEFSEYIQLFSYQQSVALYDLAVNGGSGLAIKMNSITTVTHACSILNTWWETVCETLLTSINKEKSDSTMIKHVDQIIRPSFANLIKEEKKNVIIPHRTRRLTLGPTSCEIIDIFLSEPATVSNYKESATTAITDNKLELLCFADRILGHLKPCFYAIQQNGDFLTEEDGSNVFDLIGVDEDDCSSLLTEACVVPKNNNQLLAFHLDEIYVLDRAMKTISLLESANDGPLIDRLYCLVEKRDADNIFFCRLNAMGMQLAAGLQESMDIWNFSLSTLTWSKISSFDIPFSPESVIMRNNEELIVVLAKNCMLCKFNFRTGTWLIHPSETTGPDLRGPVSVSTLDNNLLILGENYLNSFSMLQLWAYAFDDDKWTRIDIDFNISHLSSCRIIRIPDTETFVLADSGDSQSNKRTFSVIDITFMLRKRPTCLPHLFTRNHEPMSHFTDVQITTATTVSNGAV